MRNLITVVCILGCLSSCVHAEHTTNFNSLDSIVAACTKTANSYPWSRDRLDYKAYGELFTEDAVFDFSSISQKTGRIVGRDAIVEALRARGANSLTRHVSSVVQMEAIDETHAQGVSYLLLYRKSDGESTEQALKPSIFAEYHDRFRIEEGRCRISERRLELVF